ncbi:MAG TPA: NF038122 family metalloprotease, partial [Pyrinomonadaceae bacterium]|nr:NF038122 family metalloprotease [Pyrinomonadaceae bacterium]
MAFRFSARRAFALALMAIIFLPSFSIRVLAHDSSDTSTDNQVFLLYRGPDGDIACREASAAERSQLEVPRPQGLRQINHINEAKAVGPGAEALPSHLTIILRATANLQANAAAQAAFVRAATNWENLVSSPVTIYIDVDYGPNNFGQAWPAGVLGSTSSPPSAFAIYGPMRNSLIANSSSSTKSAVYAALPPSAVPTDLGSVNTVSIAKALARAIGFSDPTAPSTEAAAQIAFNSQLVTYDFDPSDGITGTDFEAVATHEIGHALGFTSTSGATPIPSSGTVTPAMWDLYRFRSGTTSATFATAPRIMTIGGPTLNSQYYFVPGATELGLSDGGPNPDKDTNKVAENSDGNQSSHWRQASLNGGVIAGYIGIMDPRIPGNIRRQITANDINALNILGYNNLGVSQGPPANDNFASAQTLTGCSGSATGTNVFATHEAGEPNHFQDNVGADRGGNRSVWYQWQAPSSGTATITTAGSGFDTVLAVYTGNSVGSLTVVGKGDDSATDVTSTLTFAATAGTVYKIAVDGFNNQSSGGDEGPISINFSLSNCTNSGAPSLQLSAANYSVGEGANFLNVDVVRTGDASTAVSVNYRTSDSAGLTSCTVANGIASERCDYATTVGTLRFAAGETIKSITIPIVDDALVEGNENFTLTLTSPTGATLGSPQTATITIIDNDAPTSQNPIDNIPFFVTQQYIDFLGRLPDATGFANWVATLNGCPNGG